MESKERILSARSSCDLTTDLAEDFELLPLKNPSWKKTLVTGLLIASLSILSLAVDWTTSFVVMGDCGDDYNTAQRKGCVFDVMLGHWVPPACFDHTIHDSYVDEHLWSWYWDSSFKDPVSKEEVLTGDYAGVWTSLEFHFFHCAYLWQLQLKSFSTGAPLVEYLWTYEHAEHCAHILVDQEFPGRNDTYVETEFERCISPRLTGP
ncbi:hypothetical protein PRZ48_012816 [Zasmidium cellare]|uniref:Uncharacterized protein n=1 Tax=Zasmidium cellare TaxID=395010 RepID=A0ABR0E5X1_ZASCE|nr:hypothetical protein PRZ48_012816 [Zasmidium cellare]